MKIKFLDLPEGVIMIYNKKTDELMVNSKVFEPCDEEVLKKINLVYKDGEIWVK
jgi:hypothetical protein